MKTFKADNDLAAILESNGLIESSSFDLNNKMKRTFRAYKQNKKGIYFDDASIVLVDEYSVQDSKNELTEQELKIVLLFFCLRKSDIKALCPTEYYRIGKVEKKIGLLEVEVQSNIRKSRKNRIERILKTLDEISFD